jgi:hypothetical protein
MEVTPQNSVRLLHAVGTSGKKEKKEKRKRKKRGVGKVHCAVMMQSGDADSLI